ncbi:MAG TPA: ABC transporter ATP-binding protein [Candidatus Binatia bacterium]|jgi:branched-chain amino acid transport system ATP-binding protein
MLKVDNLESGYGLVQVLWGASLEVRAGSITVVLGANGAGKTTLLRTILGTLKPLRGQVMYEERDVTYLAPHEKVRQGLVLVPEGRHLFVNMTVQENLLMGAYPKEALKCRAESLEIVYTLFPRLKERVEQRAGTLSGGEQQMLTIARGLMSKPKLMMLDEPSQGLAPKLVSEVFAAIEKMRKEANLTIVLVEQSVDYAIGICDYAYIIHEGRVKAGGTSSEIKQSEVREAYLGV